MSETQKQMASKTYIGNEDGKACQEEPNAKERHDGHVDPNSARLQGCHLALGCLGKGLVVGVDLAVIAKQVC